MISIADLMKKYNSTCFYCGRKITGRLKPTRDHVFPKSKGGGNATKNIVLACRDCNRSKSNKMIWEFIAEASREIKKRPKKGVGNKRKKQKRHSGKKVCTYTEEEWE